MISQGIHSLGDRTGFQDLDAKTYESSNTIVNNTELIIAKHLHKPHRPERTSHSFNTFSPLRLLLWTSLFVGARTQLTDPFPAQFELSSLDGTNGFILNGEAAGDGSGRSVSSAGDMNGDGLADLVIGAYLADPSGRTNAGKCYVLYSNRTPLSSGTLELSSLNGRNGFIINGEAANDWSGHSVSSAGDMNGDGLADLVIGAYQADPSGKFHAGKSYVIYGTRTPMIGGKLELSSLNGTNGFMLNGEAANDVSGVSVSLAGDMNGDGLSDIVIGAYQATPPGRSRAGKSYVIYGSRTPLSSGILELSSLNGANGFILNGEAVGDESGRFVTAVGDMNGDGLADLVIGAHQATPPGRSRAGKSYVIYGNRTPLSSGILELSSLNGANGFILNGEAAGDLSGFSVSSASDMNEDGLADLVIGAPDATPSGRSQAGKSYVIYGSRTLFSNGTFELSSLDGSNGFIINGEAADDRSGFSVFSAGDMNGDGLADLVIGAYFATPSGRSRAGKSYVIYGGRTPMNGSTLELSSLNGSNGFILNGEVANDGSGVSVSSAGDMNGDGLSDLVTGAFWADPSGRSAAGKSYVIFGHNVPISQSTPLSSLSFNPKIMEDSVSMQSSSTFAIPLEPLSPDAKSPTSSSSIPLIVGVVAAVTAIACSVFGGIVMYKKKRSHIKTSNPDTSLIPVHPNPQLPAGYVDINKIKSEMHSARVENEYAILPQSKPSSHYNEFPKGEAPHTTDHYDKFSLEQLNNQMAQYEDAKMAAMHANYDEIPTY